MLYIHSYAIFSSKSCNFVHILEVFGVGLASSSSPPVFFFWCVLVLKTGAFTALVQIGYKLPKKKSRVPRWCSPKDQL
jgi:hypothetical protein